MEEVWKDIDEYYQVSTLGRVKSTKKGKEKILKGYINNYGYVTLTLNGKTKKVHQLVATAFLNHAPCGHNSVVNHKNFIRHDNRLENLEIITQRDNANQEHIKSTSDFVGVYWSKKVRKWVSEIHINGKKKYLGSFDCEESASNRYQEALKYFQNGEEFTLKKRTRSSKYKGVSWNAKNKKWIARVYIDGYTKYIGSFDTEETAFENCKLALLEFKKNKRDT